MPAYNDASHTQLIMRRCISMVGPGSRVKRDASLTDGHCGFSPLVCRSGLYCHVGFNTVSARVPKGRQWIYLLTSILRLESNINY